MTVLKWPTTMLRQANHCCSGSLNYLRVRHLSSFSYSPYLLQFSPTHNLPHAGKLCNSESRQNLKFPQQLFVLLICFVHRHNTIVAMNTVVNSTWLFSSQSSPGSSWHEDSTPYFMCLRATCILIPTSSHWIEFFLEVAAGKLTYHYCAHS